MSSTSGLPIALAWLTIGSSEYASAPSTAIRNVAPASIRSRYTSQTAIAPSTTETRRTAYMRSVSVCRPGKRYAGVAIRS